MTERDELYGRASEGAALEALIEQAADGRPAIAFVEGEAGIGKTRLLEAVAERVAGRSGLVIRGDAPPTTGEPMPYAAIGRWLRDLLGHVEPVEQESLVERSTALGHLQPAWRLRPDVPPPPTSAAALSEELLTVLDAAAQSRPVVAALFDDLQWADPATLDMLASVIRSVRDGRIVVVVAARVEETLADAPLRRFRTELLRIGATSLALGPLDADDAGRLVEDRSGGGLERSDRTRIEALGRGNPLFLRELVASRAGPGATGAGAGAGPGSASALPESLLALARTRLSALSDGQVAILQLVAVVGAGCTEEIAIRTLGQPEAATIADLRRLVDGRLLVRAADGSLAIGHPFVREVLLEDALSSQRRRLAGAAARLLAAEPALVAGTETEVLTRLANLWHASGDAIRAFPALVRAAEAAERSFAFGSAMDLYAKAFDVAGAATSSTERHIGFEQPRPADSSMAELFGRAADAAILAGDPSTAIGWLDRALAGVRDDGVRGRLSLVRGRALLARGDAPAAVAVYREVLGSDGTTDASGSALPGYARALIATGAADEAVGVATTALQAARAGRSRTDEETALLVLGTALLRSGRAKDGIARLHEAVTLRQRIASESSIRPRVSRVMDLTGALVGAASAAAGLDAAEASTLSRDAAAAAGRWGAEGVGAHLRINAADEAIEAGRWGAALAILDEAVGQQVTSVGALARRARIAALRGSWDRAAADLARSEAGAIHAGPDDRAAFSIGLAELRSWRSQHDAATAAATEGLVMSADASAANRAELIAVAARSHVNAALAARAVRSAAVAADHEGVARGLVESTPAGAPDPRLDALRLTIRAEVSRLEAQGSDGAWADARSAWESVGSVWWTAYASYREGEALLAGSGQRDAARQALTRAHDGAGSLEAAPLLAEIEALGARGRIELVTARPGRAAERAPGPEVRKLPISDREMEVLVLIARGMTNKEIASELFISERTAAHHVGHIFDKLGVSSRVEAAGVAHQAGVLSA